LSASSIYCDPWHPPTTKEREKRNLLIHVCLKTAVKTDIAGLNGKTILFEEKNGLIE